MFFRIGGAGAGKATTSLVVNSHNMIIDHIWVVARPTTAPASAGPSTPPTPALIVNGDNVTASGLFVEHYQKYQVIWNGKGGRTIFFQNEMPYDPPNQAAWMNGTTSGYAAYKVADSVTTPRGVGPGQLLLLQRQPVDRGGPRLRGARTTPSVQVPQHADRLARRQRNHRPRHQQHGWTGAGHGDRPEQRDQLPLTGNKTPWPWKAAERGQGQGGPAQAGPPALWVLSVLRTGLV